MREFKLALGITRKDLTVELRSRQNFMNILFFAFLVMVIFNFVFDPGSRAMREVSPAILWIAFLFSGVLSLEHSFSREREEECILGLLLAPIPRGVLFLGKFLANLLFLMATEVLILPIFAVFFNVSLPGGFGRLVLVILLVDIGYVAVGTLFSAMTAGLKSRAVMLPILLFPVVVPVFIAGVKATTVIFLGDGLETLPNWLKILGGFDLIFTFLCYYLFKHVVEET